MKSNLTVCKKCKSLVTDASDIPHLSSLDGINYVSAYKCSACGECFVAVDGDNVEVVRGVHKILAQCALK